MIKKIVISVCLFFSLGSFAQQGTSSPYSFYGIGDVRFKGSLENRSMAGLAIEQDSIHINLQNPAGFANLKLTTFSLGGGSNLTKSKTENESANARTTTLDYLAVGLPLGKFGAGFGLIPYSSVGYKIKNVNSDDNQISELFNGSGGLNKVFLGLGYKIAPNFTFGADVNYNFGKIETNSLEFITNIPIGSREMNTAYLSGVNFNVGSMYQAKINKKLSFFSSLNYTLGSTLTSKNTRGISTVYYISNEVVESLDDVEIKTDLKLPSKITLGSGIGETKKWLLGAQVSLQNKGGLENSYNKIDKVSYEKYTKYSIGGYYIPNYTSYSSYAKRMTYRGGFKYEKTGLIINSESINDIGFTVGLGLPLSTSFSNVNFGFEMGKKGTTSSGLVQENYANVSVSFSFNDKWFVKRKFD